MASVPVASTDLHLSASMFATGWQAVLRRGIAVKATSQAIASPPPKVVSVHLRKPRTQVSSFFYPTVDEAQPTSARPASTGSKPRGKHDRASRNTRIAPPQDIVRLKDRLYYLLLPPLENLLQGASLQFPFEPFPYQYEGVAFLYPRFAAVLADEMGLGKTMQAITSTRLLLRSGGRSQCAAGVSQASGNQLAA